MPAPVVRPGGETQRRAIAPIRADSQGKCCRRFRIASGRIVRYAALRILIYVGCPAVPPGLSQYIRASGKTNRFFITKRDYGVKNATPRAIASWRSLGFVGIPTE
jgi:hypothetical protein